MNGGLNAGLQRLADRADTGTLPPPSAIRAAGERRTRRTAGLIVVAAAASVAVLVAVLNLGGQPRADRQQPAKPDGLSSSTLTFWDNHMVLVALDDDGSQTPMSEIGDLPEECQGCDLEQLAWSPDGSRAALVLQRVTDPTGDAQFEAGVWLWESGRLRHWFDCPGDQSCAAGFQSVVSWSTDGHTLYLATADGVYSARLGEQLVLVCEACKGYSAEPSPDGQWIGFAGAEGVFRVPTTGGEPELLSDVAGARPSEIRWSADGSHILADTDHGIYLVDLSGTADGLRSAATLVFSQQDGEGPGRPAWSPDGRRFALFDTPRVDGKYHAEVWVVDLDRLAQPRRLRALGCCVSDWSPVTWSPDGTRLALQVELPSPQPLEATNYVRTLHVFVLDADTGKTLQDVPGHGPVEWRARPR